MGFSFKKYSEKIIMPQKNDYDLLPLVSVNFPDTSQMPYFRLDAGFRLQK